MRKVLIAAVLLAPVVAEATTVTFQDGLNYYTGESEVAIVNGSYQNTNKSGSQTAIVGYDSYIERDLLRFDLSSIAGQYSQITSISLSLSVASTLFGSSTVNLYEVDEANADWNPTIVTWNMKTPTAQWDNGQGLGTAGYGPSLGSSPFTTGTTSLNWTISDPATATQIVNAFTDGTNNGFLLKQGTEGTQQGNVTWYGGSDGNIIHDPKLTITYTPLPEPTTGGLMLGGLTLLGLRRRRSSVS